MLHAREVGARYHPGCSQSEQSTEPQPCAAPAANRAGAPHTVWGSMGRSASGMASSLWLMSEAAAGSHCRGWNGDAVVRWPGPSPPPGPRPGSSSTAMSRVEVDQELATDRRCPWAAKPLLPGSPHASGARSCCPAAVACDWSRPRRTACDWSSPGSRSPGDALLTAAGIKAHDVAGSWDPAARTPGAGQARSLLGGK